MEKLERRVREKFERLEWVELGQLRQLVDEDVEIVQEEENAVRLFVQIMDES